jgi:5-(carboxyamino)imidazole ribonucleotide mutase
MPRRRTPAGSACYRRRRRRRALPGVLAASSPLPVIGVPVASTPLGGIDALLSIVQMPKGVPVATVAIGKWGAANAGLLAAQIWDGADDRLVTRIAAYRKRLADEVDERARKVAAQMKSGGPPKSGT